MARKTGKKDQFLTHTFIANRQLARNLDIGRCVGLPAWRAGGGGDKDRRNGDRRGVPRLPGCATARSAERTYCCRRCKRRGETHTTHLERLVDARIPRTPGRMGRP